MACAQERSEFGRVRGGGGEIKGDSDDRGRFQVNGKNAAETV